MTARRVRFILGIVLAVGFVGRIVAARLGPVLYPDAYFQSLEPAWTRVTGEGMKTWEWTDGLRSWVLPGYHGAWMALGRSLGLRGSTIGEMIRLSWGLLSMFMVWAAWRAGASCARQLRPRHPCCACGHLVFDQPAPMGFVGDAPPAGWQGGLVAAFLMATFPLLALYSVEPLTELPSMIVLIVAFALVAEQTELDPREGKGRAVVIGTLLSLAVCLRIVNGALVLLPAIWLGARHRWRDLAILAGTALVPVALFGIVDRLTWGHFFGSFLAFIKFNIIQGRAAEFGTEPATWYLAGIWARLPIGLAILVLPAICGLRATWPFVLSAAGLLGYISTQAHKEERFALLFWPFLLIAAGTVLGHWLFSRAPPSNGGAAPSRLRRWLTRAKQLVIVAGMLAVVVDGARHLRQFDFDISHARLDGQAWVARQKNATGLLLDWHFYTGATVWFGRDLPQVKYEPELLSNRLFSHVLAGKGSSVDSQARRAGFVPKFDRHAIVVLERSR
ncbi:MAG: hypothetical protein WBP56_26350 [Polyangia bacterium]|jgi:hypothetical protein